MTAESFFESVLGLRHELKAAEEQIRETRERAESIRSANYDVTGVFGQGGRSEASFVKDLEKVDRLQRIFETKYDRWISVEQWTFKLISIYASDSGCYGHSAVLLQKYLRDQVVRPSKLRNAIKDFDAWQTENNINIYEILTGRAICEGTDQKREWNQSTEEPEQTEDES